MNQSRTKAAVRGAKVKSKSGRPMRPKVRSGPELPLLPIAVGGILIVVAIVLGIYAFTKVHATPSGGPVAAAGIPCNQLEGTVTHYHVGLQIIYDGHLVGFPTDIGRTSTCFYWLHAHAESPGIIHIESPNKTRKFTLGDFFKVWAASKNTPEPLDATHVSSFTLTADQKLVIYIDNQDDKKGPQLYTGDPTAIPLTNTHEVITIEITPPEVSPPPTFTFPSGL